MHFATSNTTTGTLQRTHGNFYLAAALGLVLAALAATAAWQLNLTGTGSTTPAARAGSTYVASPREPDLTYYLVASQSQAGFVLQGQDDADHIRAADGDFGPRDDVEVLTANDGASLDLAMQDITDANAIRSQTGLAEIKLVDLRDPLR